MLCSISLVLIFFCIHGTKCQNPEVEIPQGILRGDIRTNLDGGTYYSFQSIPYAKPPLGELRFKAPEPADTWEGVRDATEDLPSCIQRGYTGGQEDCLYLNIYTPRLLEEGISQLPVMVWIHGGAFTSGSATEILYGGQFILTKEVVLVSINYRVGIFGFLSLDDPDLGVTGNAGLKDQVLALQWIRDNIQYFGGDSNNVLIFGESAGGTSVHMLMLSPIAKGLFHKAISQSGEALTGLTNPVSRNNAEILANDLNIQTDDWKAMLASLQEVPAGNLSIAEFQYFSFYTLLAGPIIEIPSTVSQNFLTEAPIDIIRSGTYNRVPFIIGFNDAEGLLFQLMSWQYKGKNLFIEDFTEFVPRDFNIDGTTLETLLAYVIKNFYYGDTQPNRNNITGAVDLTSDYAFAFPSYRTAREYLSTANDPIYFYYFTAITELNYRHMDEAIASYPGAAHGEDKGYLFYMENVTPSIAVGSIEDRMLRYMVSLWTNFAIFSNPTPKNFNEFLWEPLDEHQFNYLHIGTDEIISVIDDSPQQERMKFWWALYEQYLSRK